MKRKTEPAERGEFVIVQGDDDRPDLRVELDVHRVAEKAADLLRRDPGVFRRGGKLVAVLPGDRVRVGHKPPPRIAEIQPSVLFLHLSFCARWIRYDSRNNTWKQCIPPSNMVSAVSAMGKWPAVRPLAGVITTPTLRPDGTIFQEPGYDEGTELLFVPSASFVEVPSDPTLEDARNAADAILDVVCDFPFAKDTDRSAWLASVLTLVSRHAIDGPVPLFAVTSNTRGTGKSRLVDLASLIAHGMQAPRTPISTADDELRKMIGSVLADGSPIALLDNAKSGAKFGGPAFDALLTSTEWKDRTLGKSESVSMPATCVWFVTGNNIRFSDDLSRRTLHVRLESPAQNPEDRTDFKHGSGGALFAVVEKRRKFLVAQALTILRAHALAGRPTTQTWGSYEAWSTIVANAITWLGLPDPLRSRATEDPASDDDTIILTTMARVLLDIGRPVTAKELITELYPQGHEAQQAPDLFASFADGREVLETYAADRSGKVERNRVGYMMRRIHGRVVNATRVLGAPDPHTKINRWTAERVT